VPAALAGGHAVFLMTRGASRTSQLPRWMIGAGYFAAAAQLFSFYTLPLLLLPLWVLGACITLRSANADETGR
jgi:hypothetical protein